MLVAILIFEIVQTILVLLMYPIITYAVDKSTDDKLRERDEKVANLEAHAYMAVGRMDAIEKAVSSPVAPVPSMPDGIVMRGEGPEKNGVSGRMTRP